MFDVSSEQLYERNSDREKKRKTCIQQNKEKVLYLSVWLTKGFSSPFSFPFQ